MARKHPEGYEPKFSFVPVRIAGETLKMTSMEKKFAELFIKLNGDRVKAFEGAGYKSTSRDMAYKKATDRLRDPDIAKYISHLLDKSGFNETNVTKQHAYVITQMGDLGSKNKAIDMFYKLKGSYAPEKHVTINTTLKEFIDEVMEDKPHPVRDGE